jgi:hypothetical protein
LIAAIARSPSFVTALVGAVPGDGSRTLVVTVIVWRAVRHGGKWAG